MNEITEDTARKGKHTVSRLILARVLQKIRRKHLDWDQNCLMSNMVFQVAIYRGADRFIACVTYNIKMKQWTTIDFYDSWTIRKLGTIIKTN